MTLAVSGITKRHGAVAALDGVDLDVASGELLALLGPSGSGKTSLLRIVAGLDRPDRGRVLLDGADVTSLPPERRGIGLVFQHYALFPHMDVAANVAFGLAVRPGVTRPNRAGIDARVAELLDLVQLGGYERRRPDQLSGGQRQRVALARALAVEPRILLLDEPFGALDARVRRELRGWLRALHDRTGLTSILVTHDQEEALEIADRVAVMNRGAIEQVAPPDTLYRTPATAFVYDFLGDSNRIAVTVTDGIARFGDAALPIDRAVGSGPADLFFRPHEVAIVDDGPAIAVRVEQVRQRAGLVRVRAAATGLDRPLDLDLPNPPKPGEMLRVRPLAARLYPR